LAVGRGFGNCGHTTAPTVWAQPLVRNGNGRKPGEEASTSDTSRFPCDAKQPGPILLTILSVERRRGK